MRRGLVIVAAVLVAGLVSGGAVIWQGQARAKTSGAALPEVNAILTSAPRVPPPVDRAGNAKVIVRLETTEVRGTLADGVEYVFWTFGGTVPGPFVRVRVGDVVQLRLKNGDKSMHPHSIDLHAVTGPGGGAATTQLGPKTTLQRNN
jgi:nitrite reductase (NO-forming)